MAAWGFLDPWTSGEPWGGLERLRREMDELLARQWDTPRRSQRGVFPPVNLYEANDDFVLTAEIPGVRIEDIEVSVQGDRVTLRGERKTDYPDEERASLHRRERQSGFFRRTVTLPVPADPDKTQAVYRHGVLALRIPKAPTHRPRRIDVRAS